MEATLESPTLLPASRYWGLLKNLEDGQKLELVALLVESLRPHSARTSDRQERERGFRNLAGCWADDSGDDDVEAILRRGRASRAGNRAVPDFGG